MKTLVVANRKGGVGKTLVSTHAAWWFAEKGLRVLVVDLDTQGNTSRTLDTAKRLGDAVTLFASELPIFANITKGEVNIFNASDTLDGVKGKGAAIVSVFVSNMRGLAERFDVCVIDTSPDQNFVNLSGLIAASHVIAPVNLGDYAVDGVELMLKTIIGVKQKYNQDLAFIGLMPNMLIKNQPIQMEALRKLYATYPDKYVFPVALGHRSSFEQTVRDRRAIWMNKKTAAREAIAEMRAVMREIDKRMGVQ